jgi:CubicO group peptidase (beta-lactamase class C family)
MRRPPILVIASALGFFAAGPGPRAAETPPASSEPDLSGVTPHSLAGERRAAFEAYVADALRRFAVPGAAVAVVQDGRVVYLNGFGVKRDGGTDPVTPDTLMMIGSITKSMTTMMAATLVDDDRLSWQTRLVDLLPDFSVADPALTRQLTVRDAFCNCSGIAGKNIESYFPALGLTPEKVVTALAAVKPVAALGAQFIYNNLLIGSGGYALGVAADGSSDDLGTGYDTALRERVLGPIGMPRSTFDPDAVFADGDYALPHAVDLSGEQKPLPLSAERVLQPYRPAGGLWSSAREMARYLQTELARGSAPDGTRVVSAGNLEATWAPGVAVPNYLGGPPLMAATTTRYGLGWMNGTWHGLRVVSHGGGTGGYTSDIAFLPEAGVGIVVLTNAFALSPRSAIPLGFEYSVEIRMLELLFDQPAEIDAQMEAQSKVVAAARPLPKLGKIDAAQVQPYLGRYQNVELGAVKLLLRNGRLVLDAGQVSSELRPAAGEGVEPVYLLRDPPLSLFSAAYGVTITLTGAPQQPTIGLSVPASVTGPAQEFVFMRAE